MLLWIGNFAIAFRKASRTADWLLPNTEDVSVELDALPVDVLRMRVVAEVEKCMGLAGRGAPTCHSGRLLHALAGP